MNNKLITCPECGNTEFEVTIIKNFDGENIYYLSCNECESYSKESFKITNKQFLDLPTTSKKAKRFTQ